MNMKNNKMIKQMPMDKKRMIRETNHLTRPPRLARLPKKGK